MRVKTTDKFKNILKNILMATNIQKKDIKHLTPTYPSGFQEAIASLLQDGERDPETVTGAAKCGRCGSWNFFWTERK